MHIMMIRRGGGRTPFRVGGNCNRIDEVEPGVYLIYGYFEGFVVRVHHEPGMELYLDPGKDDG